MAHADVNVGGVGFDGILGKIDEYLAHHVTVGLQRDILGEENVDLQLKYLGVGKAERKERVLEILRKVKLSHRAKHYPHQLSGGQQQRVAIARAVVGKPSIILADEPTGNLDSKNGMEVMQLLSELNEEETTIVMVTHSKHDATYASRIINLFDGQVVDAMNDQL